MTTRRLGAVSAMVVGVTLSGTVQGALYDRGGGLIYDSVLNVTWLQNANYAATELSDSRVNEIVTVVNAANPSWLGGHVLSSSDFAKSESSYSGLMRWWGAMAWADQLTYGGFDDWRLPFVVDTGTAGCNWGYSGTDCGYNVQTVIGSTVYSELAHMYYNNLGNRAYYDTSGSSPQPGWSETPNASFTDASDGDTVSLQNLKNHIYWSGTEYAPDPSVAWNFRAYLGGQLTDNFVKTNWNYAWAVRPGDVPLPGAGLLLVSALVGLGWAHRRR